MVLKSENQESKNVAPMKNVKCPTCSKKADWQKNPHRPFCCERCKLIDLGKWAGEEYRIPTNEKTDQVPEEAESNET